MTVDIRPARPGEMNEYKRVAKRSLMVPPEIAPPDAIDAIRPEWTLCAFEDGCLVTAYAWWPLKMRLNGKSASVAGITYVGTHPVYRRRGHLRRIVSRHFEIMHETGQQPISALHASRAAIYHRYGYAVVSSSCSYAVSPRGLVFARPAGDAGDAGRLREAGAGETGTIREVYKQFVRDRTGCIHRAAATWETGALAPVPDDGALFQVVYEAAGVAEGYVIYAVRPGETSNGRLGQTLLIRDLSYLSARAYHALWRHVSGFDLAGEIRWMRAPADDPLPHLVREPAELDIRVRDGIMARIVDVAGAVSARGYAAEGRLCFELTDDLCPWNRGRWQVEIAGGCAEAARTEQAPEVRLPVDTLAMLVFGQIPTTRAAQMGRLEVIDSKALPEWDRLWRTRHSPFCPDFF